MIQLLQNAAYGTAMILAVVLLRRVLKNRLLPGARLALWAACLFRLLTPAAPESVLSLWGLSRLFETQTQPAAPAPAPNMTGYVLGAGAPAAPAPQPSPAISWEMLLPIVWLVVGAALAVRYVLSWTRTRRAVACAVLLDRDDPRYTALPKHARLREGPMEGAPLTFGVVRPTVVLSPGLEAAELDCVLAHEAVHAARRDNLWHYAMALALAVHWWNPAVWLMSRLLRRDIELSCDRAALKKLGADRRADYANALVSLAAQTEGPAFCQTFGRKAAEERILSIMKFKKTSVIGVVFTLALVLAVTVAFASEPKEPDDTIVFHGQTYSRSDLSQDTLDWLDWYLALPEEEQLAISMVPPELISSEDFTAYDDYAVTKESIFSWGMTSDPDDGSVKTLTISLDYLEKSLAEHVADGSIAQEEADRVLEEAQLFSKDGRLTCAFQPGSGLYGADRDNPNRGLSYLDGQGNFIPTDPATVLSVFVFPSFAAVPDYVEDLPELPVTVHVDIPITGYEVVLPSEVDENGNSTFRDEDGNVILQGFARYVLDDDGVLRVGGDPVNPASFPAGTAAPSYTTAPSGSDGANGLCSDPDCQFSEPHYHDNDRIISKYYVLEPSTSPSPAPSFVPDPLTAQPFADAAASCGVEGCTETRHHAHSEGCVILLSDPCPVEGCTITGNHTHNGVNYSCNGYHSGGRCDGSCYTHNTPSSAAPSGTAPSGTTSTGVTSSGTHHSESHHSGGHH